MSPGARRLTRTAEAYAEAVARPLAIFLGDPLKQSLSLKREALAELSDLDLGAVAAGALPSGPTCPIQSCLCVSRIGECVTWSCHVAG